ncbi:MAG TPA: type II toxin-antitoxin system RelE/ParE family toxin [Pirellulales bacterium]|jgi:mRNA-degrading endonuclease RelE of RelBE toxin-antitoxin system
MPYTIEITDLAFNELAEIKKFYREQIVEAIDNQLLNQPTVETKNRKVLIGIQPDFEHDPPVWELRVGQYRVFYDVNEELKVVFIRAVRNKPPHKTTEKII